MGLHGLWRRYSSSLGELRVAHILDKHVMVMVNIMPLTGIQAEAIQV